MVIRTTQAVSRRSTIRLGVAGLALGVGAAQLQRGNAAPNVLHGMQGGGGAAGGGTISTDDGDAQFLFFGTRLEFTDHDSPFFFGNFQWLGADGMGIESIEITNYGPIEGEPEADRILEGIATMNGEGRFAFTVRIVDGGPLGEGLDRLSLTVGPEASGTPAATPEPIFTAEGTVTVGDIQLVNLVADEE